MTIHILKYGESYCDMPAPPSSWPPEDLWVSFEDDWPREATCAACSHWCRTRP